MEEKTGKKKNHTLIAVLFAISGLICWCGISQVISNSVASSFENCIHIPPLYTTIVLVAVAAVIVLRKNRDGKSSGPDRADYGCMLFLHYDFCYSHKYEKYSKRIWSNL